MSRPWINKLAEAHAMEVAKKRATLTGEPMEQMVSAFKRVQNEIRDTIDELNERFEGRFFLAPVSDTTWAVRTRAGANIGDAARFDFDEAAMTIRTQPTLSFGVVPAEHRHTFTFDPESRSFNEGDESICDEELVRRAMEPFLMKNLSAGTPLIA